MTKKKKLDLVPARKSDLRIGVEYYINNGSKLFRQTVRRQLPSETDDEYSGYKKFLGYVVDEKICFINTGL